MVELKAKPNSTPSVHKDAEGRDCTCTAAVLHHKDSFGRDCKCFIGKDHHRNSKDEECTCRIGTNHNTKSSPHKDADGRSCSGPFMTSSILTGKRTCNWCRREESYSLTEIIIVFKKGVSVGAAGNFVMNFRLNDQALLYAKDKAHSIVEKNGVVAMTVVIPTAAGKTLEEWLTAVEGSEFVWFASRVMVMHYPTSAEMTTALEPKRKKPRGEAPDFPSEFQEA